MRQKTFKENRYDNNLSIEKFTRYLKDVLTECGTGLYLENTNPIFLSRPEIKMYVNPSLLDYFKVNKLLFEMKPFSFFVGKKLILREIRGFDNVLQIVDDKYNMLELKMKPDIELIYRKKKIRKIIRESNRYEKDKLKY